ncbi:MAG: hypothetical protein V8Q30_02345 [Acutalibacteraceae bacterium]
MNEGETIVCGGAADSGAVGADVLGGRHRAAGGCPGRGDLDWYEEDCWLRDYDDDTVQYLNFTRQEVIFDPELEQVTLHFGNDAVYTVALGEERSFLLGCVTEPDQELRAALGDQTGEAEVVDFTGDPRFEAVGTLTLRSEKQYLYLWEDGVFTLLDSVWDGSTHTLQTAELGCYVLTDTPL